MKRARHQFPSGFLTLILITLVAAASVSVAAEKLRLVIAVKKGDYQKVEDAVRKMNGEVRFRYKNLDGLAVSIPAAKLTDLLSSPAILRVAKDELVTLPSPKRREIPGYGVVAPVYEVQPSNGQALTIGELQGLSGPAPANYYPFDNLLTHAFEFSNLTGHFGENVIVGIIDAGVSTDAFAVAGPGGSRIVGAENFTNDGIPGDSPLNGFHGTAVACCVGANAVFGFDNPAIQNAVKRYAPDAVIPNFFGPGVDGIPMVGQAPAVSFYSLKVFPFNSNSTSNSIVLAALDRAIELKDMYNHGTGGVNLRVVNLSLGGATLFAGNDPMTVPLVKRANEVGIVLTMSSGNDGPAGMTIGNPGDSKNILTVGASNDATHERIVGDIFFLGPGGGSLLRPVNNNIVADFSSRGPTADGRGDPEIVAPGVWRYAQGATGGIVWASGTSFSAPTVAGAAALLISAHPQATPNQIRAALIAGANPHVLDGDPEKLDQGAGMLDVLKAHQRFGSFNPADRGFETPFVRLNIFPFRLKIVDDNSFSGSTGWLNPGERREYYVATTDRPLGSLTVNVNVTAELPPAEQNPVFGDDALVTVASAKTSTGDYRAGAFVPGSATFTLGEQDLELGFTRVTVTGDNTNAGRVKASLSISNDRSVNQLRLFALGKLGQGENRVHTLAVAAGTPSLKLVLVWDQGWEMWPTNDLDLLVLDPNGNPVLLDNDGDDDLDGLSLDVPERLTVTAPAAGTWSFIVIGSTVWKGKEGYALFKEQGLPSSMPAASAEPSLKEVPSTFDLAQNYPNPFNPSTVIRYGLPVDAHVRLTVFNMLGQEVATLVDGEEVSGFHQVVFRDPGLASGVYFYRLNAGGFVSTRQLLLMK